MTLNVSFDTLAMVEFSGNDAQTVTVNWVSFAVAESTKRSSSLTYANMICKAAKPLLVAINSSLCVYLHALMCLW